MMIWMRTVGADFDNERAIVPGIGEYSGSRTFNDGQITLSKIDLIGGGFRSGDGGLALFPVKDVQGSVRGYASKNGLEQAIGYLPYGTTIYLDERFVDEGNKRWQGKEFDEEHEKYYFGARYYDPFFGMWMSPDPAGQFANPYSYGGDPINYIDPTGMWSFGVGLVVGWNKENGWGFGYGGAVEFFDLGYDFSFKFNQDGSKSLNLGLNTKLDIQTIVYLEVEMGLAFSMNSYTGATLSTHRGVCVGEATACVGVGGGGSLYWDRGGSFMGATVYGEVYASLGFGMGRFSAGYEAGLFGMEGRGMYVGASTGINNASLYASWAENGGGSYGGDKRFDMAKYSSKNGWEATNTAKAIGGLFAVDTEGSLLSAGGQLLSRFTWELPQTLLGLSLAIGASELGMVDEVDYARGTTLVRYGVDIGGALTLGSYIAGNNLYATRKELNERNLFGMPLLPHEYGHVIQSRIWGMFYLPFIALPSVVNALFVSPRKHMDFFIEKDATEKGSKYLWLNGLD